MAWCRIICNKEAFTYWFRRGTDGLDALSIVLFIDFGLFAWRALRSRRAIFILSGRVSFPGEISILDHNSLFGLIIPLCILFGFFGQQKILDTSDRCVCVNDLPDHEW